MRSMRPGTCGAVDSRSAIASAGTPTPQAQAATPNALVTLKRPSNGSLTGALPIGVMRSKRLPLASVATRLAVTSPPRSPNVTRRCRRGSRCHAASSALTTSRPSSAR